MNLQAVTGQLYLIEGETQEATAVPGLLAQSAPKKAARSRDRDSLFIHLSLTGQPEETAVLTQDLLDIINQQFFATSGSVTAALRQAILKANELLLRLNVSGTGESREGAITCAVLRNGELFALQAGEGLAYLGHNFGVERLPAKEPDRITPLGRSAGLDIRFSHHRLEVGDLFLLADPRVAHLPTQSLAPALVDTEIEVGLGALADVIREETGRFLLVEFAQNVPAEFQDVTQVSQRSGKQLPEPPTPTPVRESLAEQPTIPLAAVENSARQATSEAAMGLSRLTGWLAALMARLRPPQPTEEQPVNRPLAASLAIIIPIVVAVIVTGVYLQRGRIRRMAEIKVEMGQNLAQAEGAGDDHLARQYYAGMLQLALEADTLNPNDDKVDRLVQRAQDALDRLDNVTRLAARPFYAFNETTQLTAVVLREGFNGGIYTLDGANSHVYWHDTDETYLNPVATVPEQIVFQGEAIGSHVVHNIVDMMWRPRGLSVSREGLAMLDDNGALLTYFADFGDTRPVPLGFASEWQFPTEITNFSERLYILDNGAAVIWKYFPDGDGFVIRDDERTLAFTDDADLAHVKDLALYSEDGSLILVYDDGRIRYYDTRSGRIQWDELSLLQNDFTLPLFSPTAVKMIGPGANASIWVADPGSGRIVEISRGGLVLAQFRATDENGRELFANITDFAVAKSPLRIFVTSGNTLFVATQE